MESIERGGAEAAGSWQCDKPCDKYVAEYFPVDVLLRSQSTDADNGADLTVSRGQRQCGVRTDEHCQSRADLDGKTAVTGKKQNILIQCITV